MCNDSPCQAAYRGTATVSLSAADPVSGCETYVTTNGSTPNVPHSVHQAPLIVHETETIIFFPMDNAGTGKK